jgi:hypothetical protein
MKKAILYILILCVLQTFAQNSMPRVIVLTDGEVDDQSSMVRFLLYTNDFDVEAIIQTNSVFQRVGHSKEGWLNKQLDAYEKDYPNLIIHDPNYPTAASLRKKCFVGDEDSSHLVVDHFASKRIPGNKPKINPDTWADTPGSDKVVEVLLKDDPRPVFIQAWGGGNTAAKAFSKLKKQYPDKYDKAVAKVVMYNIWYQDAAGNYIETFHPNVTMLVSYHFNGTWDYGSQAYTKQFVDDKLHHGKGNLCKLYPQKDISEGDSPSFLYTIPNGLRSYENPGYGGWGGLFYKLDGFKNVYRDANKGSYARWVEYANNDFEARLKWCEASKYEDANHKPIARIKNGLDITVKSGEKVFLEAEYDDPDPLDIDGLWEAYRAVFQQQGIDRTKFGPIAEKNWPKCQPYWWQFEEAGTYKGFVKLIQTDDSNLTFIAPGVSKPATIHIVLEVTDRSIPKLTAFSRVVITVLPN